MKGQRFIGAYPDEATFPDLSPVLPNGESEAAARTRLVALVMPLYQQARLAGVNLHRRTDAWVLPASADPYLGQPGVERIFGLPVIWSPEERYGLFYEVPRGS